MECVCDNLPHGIVIIEYFAKLMSLCPLCFNRPILLLESPTESTLFIVTHQRAPVKYDQRKPTQSHSFLLTKREIRSGLHTETKAHVATPNPKCNSKFLVSNSINYSKSPPFKRAIGNKFFNYHSCGEFQLSRFTYIR